MTVIVKHVQRDTSVQELLIEYHVCQAVIGRRLPLRLMKPGRPAVLVKRGNTSQMRHNLPASLARPATSAPNLPQLPSRAAALRSTALQRLQLLTLPRQATTPLQLLLPTNRESAKNLARLDSLAWEESSRSASRVQPTSPTLLKIPASPAQRVLLGLTKPQPAPPRPTPSANRVSPALHARKV